MLKRYILLFLAGLATIPMAGAQNAVSVNGLKELRNYWIYDHAASLPLAESAGMDIIVPPAMIKKAGPWKKTYRVRIDETGKVTGAECTDCAPGDPVAPIMAKGFFVERYKPAPGNTKRVPVHALLPAELIQPGN